MLARHPRTCAPLLAAALTSGFLFASLLPAGQPSAARAEEAVPLLEHGVSNAGVGVYTDGSVGHLLAPFTINERMVSCAVGTLTPGPSSSGPFAMLMYATRIDSYQVEPGVEGRLVAEGRMRSITRVGGLTVEDVEHDFLAIAVDRRGDGPDRFDVHMISPFWNLDNPMATPSEVRDGWVRFGGEVIADPSGAAMGEVVVDGPAEAPAADGAASSGPVDA